MARIGRPNRTPEALRAAILQLLATKPLMKWQVRQALHEPEGFVQRQLVWLRDDGQVKVVGRKLDLRAWALASWTDPERAHRPPQVERPYLVRRAAPPTDSWWITHSRESFAEAARARATAARWTTEPAGVYCSSPSSSSTTRRETGEERAE